MKSAAGARAEHDARVAQVGRSTVTFLGGEPEGLPLADVWEFLSVMERDDAIISRGLNALLNRGALVITQDRRLVLS